MKNIWYCHECSRRGDMDSKMQANNAVAEHGVVSPNCAGRVRFGDLDVMHPHERRTVEGYTLAEDE